MTLLTQKDFQTKAGQEKIIRTIHQLEVKLYEIETEFKKLSQKERSIERELQGPEAY